MHNYQSDFPIFANNPELIYLDSAATTQKPAVVINAIKHFYEHEYATTHRGLYDLSIKSTEKYEQARSLVQNFIKADSSNEIIFTRNATEGINLLAFTLGSSLKKDDEIILSELEHHANLVPWQQAIKNNGGIIKYAKLTEEGEIDLVHFRTLINSKTRIVSLSHLSNVLGKLTPLSAIKKILTEQGSEPIFISDLSQSIPHVPVSISDLGCDFAVFSSHKLYGPSGIGVLWGREALLAGLPPYQTGGDMIKKVTLDESSWNDLPWKFEAGTPNIEGAIGLGAAISYLNTVGMDQVAAHTASLFHYAHEKLRTIPEVALLGNPDPESGILAFTIDDIHPHDLAELLNQKHICIRAGHHCAEPLHNTLEIAASNRVSFGIYNNQTDIDALEIALKEIISDFRNV